MQNLKKFARIFIAGGLGWAFLGPIGGIIGIVLGAVYENADDVPKYTGERHSGAGDFGMSLIVLVAAVMKADGKVVKSELDYVKKFFTQNFGEAPTRELLLVLRDVLKQNISVADVGAQIKQHMDYSSRLQLIHMLYGLANVDGIIDRQEIEIISLIADYTGISQDDHQSIKAMFYNDIASCYQVLGISSSATNEEIKKAYRQMANKYHPDKVSYLGDEFQQDAKEKFQKVTKAYEKIKHERNFT